MTYVPPITDLRFALDAIAGLGTIPAAPGYEAADAELADAVLSEAGRLAAEVLAPLNQSGDRQGAVLENGAVRTPDGFRDAYRRFAGGGWTALPFSTEFGGQGLPWALAMAVQELWQSANMGFALCPLLSQAGIDLLIAHGSPEQQRTYLPHLLSGAWTGSMILTEPQAGSDVGALACRAVPDGDAWRLSGQKIFTTYGEHDFTDNIVHMVLARTPGAPAGTRGISLFVVPKFLPDAQGRPGRRNDVRCVSLEHKLGIHASPTAVMAFGDDDGAVGFLVGEECRGIEYMFTMMNNARLGVGVQGIGIAERAWQRARAYALARIQGRPIGAAPGAPIAHHPDVRRMLMTMKAEVEAGRALALYTATALDQARRSTDLAERAAAQATVDLLTPVVKGWGTEIGCRVASTAIQVHGGVGYIEETGAAQHLRDARIAPIYEGTNGIQANDLVFRKLGRDHGAAARAFIAEARPLAADLHAAPGEHGAAIAAPLARGLESLEAASVWLAERVHDDPAAAAAGATPYLELFGTVAGGVMMARAARVALERLAAGAGDARFLRAKLATACFYAERLLPQAAGLAAAATSGNRWVMALDDQDL